MEPIGLSQNKIRTRPTLTRITGVLMMWSVLFCNASAGVEQLRFRGKERLEVAPDHEIVDGRWIVIGNSDKAGGHVFRDTEHPYKGNPVYRFKADSQEVNRIEFSELFGSAERLKGFSKEHVDQLVAMGAADGAFDLGQYGDTITYEWSTRFPEPLKTDSGGIFAQWHARPDRTMVEVEGQPPRLFSLTEFAAVNKAVEFREDGRGYDRASGKKTTYRRDAAAGGPIAEFKVGLNHIFLLVRSEASRRSDSEVRLKPKPAQEIGHVMKEGQKEAALVWKWPLYEVSTNTWIDFKVRIHFSEYAADADRVLTPGAVTLWVDGKQVADWKGNIGQNDVAGPYFKFGIYKPGPGGFCVEHAGFRNSIERTRKNVCVPNPVREETSGKAP